MRAIFILLISLSSHAESKDQWICTDEATLRQGSLWYACGVGEGTTEAYARQKALEHAIDEFKSLCQMSSDCRGKDTSAEPKRTTCMTGEGWWKCYRLIQISVD
jgi:hypothetical protein